MKRHVGLGRGILGLSALLIASVNGCEAPEDGPAEVPVALPFQKQSQKYFAGLDETVTVVKGFGSGHVVRANGSIQLLSDVVEQDAAAWISEHGMLTPEVVAYVATVEPTELVPVAFVFEPSIDWEDYFEALNSEHPEWEVEQKEILQDAIALTATSIIEHLVAAGVDPETIRAAKWSPFVHAQVPAGLLSNVSMVPEVTRVIPDAAVEAKEQANNNVNNVATFHGKGTLPSGIDGQNYRAGLLEFGACRIRGTHTLLNTSPQYSYSGLTCSISPQCGVLACDPDNTNPSVCVSGVCLDNHGTQVASVLMRYVPLADLYIPNQKAGQVCSPEITNSYDFLVENSVEWVNESYSCLDAVSPNLSPSDGVVQDYHARVHNVFITKAAGNSSEPEGTAACADTWNSVCVGSFDYERELSCFSAVDNPNAGIGSLYAIDREEPDLMAYGGQRDCPGSTETDTLRVAVANTNNGTGQGNGTSFASPSALGMTMLTDEYCRSLPVPKNWGSVQHRAAAMLASLVNITEWDYSTLQDNTTDQGDHDDGAGGLFVSTQHKFCDEPEEGSDTDYDLGAEVIKPSSDGNTTPLPNADPEFPDEPPGANPLDQSLQPSGQTGYRWMDLWDANPKYLEEGMRVRAVFSWEACVTTASPSSPRTVPTDFDLFLYNKTLGQGLYASQTDDDVNEGFDVNIPEGWDGTYQLLVIWPDGSSGCGANSTERTAWGWMIKG